MHMWHMWLYICALLCALQLLLCVYFLIIVVDNNAVAIAVPSLLHDVNEPS